MPSHRRIALALLAALPLSAPGCGWFEDPTPENLRFRMSGDAGARVQVVYSTQFVAAVDEQGVTRVSLFWADTLAQTLPVDTTLYIGIDRRFFVQVLPAAAESLTVDVRVDVDDRSQLSERGAIRTIDPWRYVYFFNQRTTRIIDTVL